MNDNGWSKPVLLEKKQSVVQEKNPDDGLSSSKVVGGAWRTGEIFQRGSRDLQGQKTRMKVDWMILRCLIFSAGGLIYICVPRCFIGEGAQRSHWWCREEECHVPEWEEEAGAHPALQTMVSSWMLKDASILLCNFLKFSDRMSTCNQCYSKLCGLSCYCLCNAVPVQIVYEAFSGGTSEPWSWNVFTIQQLANQLGSSCFHFLIWTKIFCISSMLFHMWNHGGERQDQCGFKNENNEQTNITYHIS